MILNGIGATESAGSHSPRGGTALLSYTGGAPLNSPPDYLEGEIIDWKVGTIGGKSSQLFHVVPLWIDPSRYRVQHAQGNLHLGDRVWRHTSDYEEQPRETEPVKTTGTKQACSPANIRPHSCADGR